MPSNFLNFAVADSVLQAQKHYYGSSQPAAHAPARDSLTEEEIRFIGTRDSFYLSTITETGWPYIQHRGGRAGFLRVVNPQALAFADYQGNRQMLSTGNLAANSRVALFLMDYPQRARLKILGHARVEDAKLHPDLVRQMAEPDAQRIVERLFFIDVVAFDWNCPKYIAPRYTKEEIEELVAPLKERIADLEAKLRNPPAPLAPSTRGNLA